MLVAPPVSISGENMVNKNFYTLTELMQPDKSGYISKPRTPERIAEIKLDEELDFVKEHYKELITNMIENGTSAAEELADYFKTWRAK